MEKRARECGQSWLVNEISKVGNYVDSLTGSHIRLGDLITLESKTPLDILRVTNQLLSYVGDGVCEILLASDTLEMAQSIISNILPRCKIEKIDCDPWNTITKLTTVNNFVGTNSKISVWIAILLLHRNELTNVSLPQEVLHHIESNFMRRSDYPNLIIY